RGRSQYDDADPRTGEQVLDAWSVEQPVVDHARPGGRGSLHNPPREVELDAVWAQSVGCVLEHERRAVIGDLTDHRDLPRSGPILRERGGSCTLPLRQQREVAYEE